MRFRRKRTGLAAIALTTDMSVVTAAGNDFDFESIFSRQVEALGKPEDTLIAISTSGTSPNVIHAAQAAKDLKMKLVTITGSKINPLEDLADFHLAIPSENTARIQECYLFLGHLICEGVERELS